MTELIVITQKICLPVINILGGSFTTVENLFTNECNEFNLLALKRHFFIDMLSTWKIDKKRAVDTNSNNKVMMWFEIFIRCSYTLNHFDLHSMDAAFYQ